jgi:hypothetical protein
MHWQSVNAIFGPELSSVIRLHGPCCLSTALPVLLLLLLRAVCACERRRERVGERRQQEVQGEQQGHVTSWWAPHVSGTTGVWLGGTMTRNPGCPHLMLAAEFPVYMAMPLLLPKYTPMGTFQPRSNPLPCMGSHLPPAPPPPTPTPNFLCRPGALTLRLTSAAHGAPPRQLTSSHRRSRRTHPTSSKHIPVLGCGRVGFTLQLLLEPVSVPHFSHVRMHPPPTS